MGKTKNINYLESKYRNLNPVDDLPMDNEYIKALNYGINDSKIKNIALTGPYGSGKSSIINSYIKSYNKKRTVNITLSNFHSSEQNNIETNDSDLIEKHNRSSNLELAILKQLFYKVKSKDIPQSRFKKIEKVNLKKIYTICTLLSIVILIVFCFLFPNLIDSAKIKIQENANHYSISLVCVYLVAFLLFLSILAILSQIIYFLVVHYRIREIKIDIDKVSISSGGKESVFDKTIDEILYFFQETKYEVVFLEDLDRFNDTTIFIRLRELNTLINNYESIKNKVVFVYAIRDELFTNEERTKFFDFIIPVIPFINSTNANEKLKELLADEKNEDGSVKKLKYGLSFRYINLISPFINNMRILTNVCNEFIIFRNLLNNVDLNNENLFSIILFKNLYPNDFSDLENETGVVKSVFKNKKHMVDLLASDLRKKKRKLQDKLEGIDNEILKDIKEVKSAMFAYLADYKSGYYLNANGRGYYYDDIMKDDFDLSIFNQHYNFRIDCNRESDIYGNSLKEKLENSGKNYLQRIEYLKDSSKDRKQTIRNEIFKYNKQIDDIYTYSLQYLLNNFDIAQSILENIKDNDLLIFLLRNGYINENYADYINYFHPNSITEKEMGFIRRIRMHQFTEGFGVPLKNIARICEYIEDFEFKQREVLNFDLIDYLMENPEPLKIKNFFLGFLTEDDPHIQFIKFYIIRKKNVPVFIKGICKYYNNFWYGICKRNGDDVLTKEDYFHTIIAYATINDIKNMNIKNSVNNFVVENPDILIQLNDISSDKLISIIKELNIKFVNVNFENVDNKIVDFIFENNYYIINEKMIYSYFKVKYPNQLQKLSTENYTTILNTENQALISFIKNNLKEYIEHVFIRIKENTNEDKDTVKLIIKYLVNYDIDLCVQVLKKEQINWGSFIECFEYDKNQRDICLILWNTLLIENKIDKTWSNVELYYNFFALTDELIHWIETSIDTIICTQISDDFINKDLFEKLLTSKILSNDAFVKLINKYRPNEFNYNLNDFTEEKLEKMIDINYIPLSNNYFKQIKSINPNIEINYLLNQKSNFLDKVDTFDLDITIITSLLECKCLEEIEKLKILNLLDEEDITYDISRIIRNMKIAIDKKYVNAAWKLLELDEKYELFLNQVDSISNEDISLKLRDLDNVYQKLSDNNKRHAVKLFDDENLYNQRLLKKLEKKGYLSSVKKKDNYLIAWVRKR